MEDRTNLQNLTLQHLNRRNLVCVFSHLIFYHQNSSPAQKGRLTGVSKRLQYFRMESGIIPLPRFCEGATSLISVSQAAAASSKPFGAEWSSICGRFIRSEWSGSTPAVTTHSTLINYVLQWWRRTWCGVKGQKPQQSPWTDLLLWSNQPGSLQTSDRTWACGTAVIQTTLRHYPDFTYFLLSHDLSQLNTPPPLLLLLWRNRGVSLCPYDRFIPLSFVLCGRSLDVGEEDRPVGNQRCEHLSPESFIQLPVIIKLSLHKQLPPYGCWGLRIRAAAGQNQGFWWVQFARGPKSGVWCQNLLPFQEAQLADSTLPFHWLLFWILRSSSLTWPVLGRHNAGFKQVTPRVETQVFTC